MEIMPINENGSTPEKNRGDFITTYSGAAFYINELNIEDIPIQDIAHALSRNCRFNGHICRHYSVAEHSVLVSELVPKEYALWGLLHDISEAFVPDIPRPFKHIIGGFKEYEERLLEKVAKFYDLPYPIPEPVHYIDRHIVAAEAEKLFLSVPAWTKEYDQIKDLENYTFGVSAGLARQLFMDRYEDLMFGEDKKEVKENLTSYDFNYISVDELETIA